MPFFAQRAQPPLETPDEARLRVARELSDELEHASMRAKSVGMPLMAELLGMAVKEAAAIVAKGGRDP